MALTSVLTIWLLMASAYLKKKIFNMDEKEWAEYLKGISQARMIAGLIVLFLLSLFIVSTGAFFSFKILGFSEPGQMAVLFLIFTTLCAGIDLIKNKDSFFKKISMFRK